MKNFYVGLFDVGCTKDNEEVSFWFDILRVVSPQEGDDESDESGSALFSIEKANGEWLVDIFFIHII